MTFNKCPQLDGFCAKLTYNPMKKVPKILEKDLLLNDPLAAPMVLVIDPGDLGTMGRHSTTDLHPQSFLNDFWKKDSYFILWI